MTPHCFRKIFRRHMHSLGKKCNRPVFPAITGIKHRHKFFHRIKTTFRSINRWTISHMKSEQVIHHCQTKAPHHFKIKRMGSIRHAAFYRSKISQQYGCIIFTKMQYRISIKTHGTANSKIICRQLLAKKCQRRAKNLGNILCRLA